MQTRQQGNNVFDVLEAINARPEPFEFYTASDLWTDDHTSEHMLRFHLNENIDVASRKADFINRSVEWIVSRFDVGQGTRIADFGCGPGLYAKALARRQASVTGIDFSGRSLRYAKEDAVRESLAIDYVHQNYLEFTTDDRFHLILMIMCDFCALSPIQRKNMLAKFRTFLEPGGSVLLDVYSLRAFEGRQETATYEADLLDGFWSPNRYYGFLNTFKYEAEKVVLDKYTLVEPTRMWTVYNWLQYFSPQGLEMEFAESGLAVREYYSDVAGSPFDTGSSEFAVVANRL